MSPKYEVYKGQVSLSYDLNSLTHGNFVNLSNFKAFDENLNVAKIIEYDSLKGYKIFGKSRKYWFPGFFLSFSNNALKRLLSQSH